MTFLCKAVLGSKGSRMACVSASGLLFSTEENSLFICTQYTLIPGQGAGSGSGPEGTGRGGPGWTIKGEFAANGVKNDLKHTRGVLSMARSMMPDSAGSQFFIMHEDAPHLDGSYAAFGKVIEGMEAVDEIAETQTDYSDKPVTPQIIKRMYIK